MPLIATSPFSGVPIGVKNFLEICQNFVKSATEKWYLLAEKVTFWKSPYIFPPITNVRESYSPTLATQQLTSVGHLSIM